MKLLAEQVNSAHTRTLAQVARFAHGLESDQQAELLRIVQAGIQQRDEHAKALRAQTETPASPAPSFGYVKGGYCYICGLFGALYRWDDHDESSECICYTCAERARTQAGAQ